MGGRDQVLVKAQHGGAVVPQPPQRPRLPAFQSLAALVLGAGLMALGGLGAGAGAGEQAQAGSDPAAVAGILELVARSHALSLEEVLAATAAYHTAGHPPAGAPPEAARKESAP